MRRLAVDPGSARIGLSRSDEEGRVAFPLTTLHGLRGEAAVQAVAEHARSSAVGEVVVGLPLRLSGQEGMAARRARRFAAALERVLGGVPVVLWDERLTTVAATRALREAGLRAREQRQVVDQTAATLLLQSYLDARGRDAWAEATTTTTGARPGRAAGGACRRPDAPPAPEDEAGEATDVAPAAVGPLEPEPAPGMTADPDPRSAGRVPGDGPAGRRRRRRGRGPGRGGASW